MQFYLFTVVPMILVLASASAESHLRGLQAKDPPILDDFWNDSRQSCSACGGFWPTTQPANCHDRWGTDLTRCGDASPTSAPTASPTSAPTASPTSNPTSESQPTSSSPTSDPTMLPIGSGCCSQNFRTCVTYGDDSKESCELLGSMIWLENGDLSQQCLEQDSTCTDDFNACCPGLTCDGDQWYKQCKFMPNSTKSPTSAPTAFLTKPSDSPSSNEDTIDSLRAAIADLEASSSATIESLEESIVQKDSIIADLTLQIETMGVPTDPTSQCNAEDGKLAFDTCRCEELTVLKNEACAQVPVDCVNGLERGTGLTCEKACDGQCCAGTASRSSCLGFTGLVHRDGSCIGSAACEDTTTDEVKGPSCTGRDACRRSKFNLVTESCNGDYVCKSADVGLIERSCNKGDHNNGNDIIAVSIIDGEIDVCSNECRSAYTAAGEDGRPGDSCDNEFGNYHRNYCTYLACNDECDKSRD